MYINFHHLGLIKLETTVILVIVTRFSHTISSETVGARGEISVDDKYVFAFPISLYGKMIDNKRKYV